MWIAVPLTSIFQLAFLGAGRKMAGLFQARLWFRGAGWACGLFFFLMGNESDMCLSQHLELVSHWFPLFPLILRTNWKLYETGGLRCWFSKWADYQYSGWNGEPEHQEMKNEVRFRNLSRSHGVPSSGFPMHIFAVGRFPWTWRFGTHGMGVTQYYFKGSAFAHPSSPIISSPRVCSLMSLILWVQMWAIQVASEPLNEFCKNFSLFHCLCFVCVCVIYFYNGV